MLIFMKSYLISIFLVLTYLSPIESFLSAEGYYYPLASDIKDKYEASAQSEFPRNYRTTQWMTDSDQGMSDLNIAGTAQFNEYQLANIANDIRMPIIVVDLREETHLIIQDINQDQIPVTAYHAGNTGNAGRTLAEIDAEIEKYRSYIQNLVIVPLYQTNNGIVLEEANAPIYQVDSVFTEKEVVERVTLKYFPGISYFYLPVTDHDRPRAETVDQFVENLASLNLEQVAVVFHCRAGRGRTGQFMNMMDMIKNAKKYGLSFDEILKRQERLGSPDYYSHKENRLDSSIERLIFLRHFYEYAVANDGYYGGVSYSKWLNTNPRK